MKNNDEEVKIDTSNSNININSNPHLNLYQEIKQKNKILASACVMDPSCSTVLISYSDGGLQLWPLIGIILPDKTVSNNCDLIYILLIFLKIFFL